MPNPNTISTYRYQDIQIPDESIRKQFKQYMKIGRYADALDLLTTNAQKLQGKAYVAEAINKISAGIVDLEKRYIDGVPVFLSDLAHTFNTLIKNMKRMGLWQNSIQYYPYSYVVYNQEIYLCLKEPPIGTLPTVEQYWLYLGLRGEEGAYGIDVNMKYGWTASAQYKTNDLVVYNQNIYVALKDNAGANPETDETAWMLFILVVKGEINIGMNPPTILAQNTIWFKTKSDPLVATTAEPIYGEFFRYVVATKQWEEMYPNTVFTLIDGYEQYANMVENIEVTIKPADWVNDQFTYPYRGLDKKTTAFIYPSLPYDSGQTKLYNQLKLTVNANDLVLAKPTSTTIDFDLPIVISIQ